MKSVMLLFAALGIAFTALAQEIKVAVMPNMAETTHIYVLNEDKHDLGIVFTDKVDVTEVRFAVHDAVLRFSKTNQYLIYFDRELDQIEFGCVVKDTRQKGHESGYRYNDRFILKLNRSTSPESGISSNKVN